MTVTVESFLVAFPEFAKANAGMLAAQLAMVELDVSDAFCDSRDLAVMLRLADTLALSPFGRDARMIPKGVDNAFSSTYGLRFQRLAEANGITASRLGSAPGVRAADDCP